MYFFYNPKSFFICTYKGLRVLSYTSTIGKKVKASNWRFATGNKNFKNPSIGRSRKWLQKLHHLQHSKEIREGSNLKVWKCSLDVWILTSKIINQTIKNYFFKSHHNRQVHCPLQQADFKAVTGKIQEGMSNLTQDTMLQKRWFAASSAFLKAPSTWLGWGEMNGYSNSGSIFPLSHMRNHKKWLKKWETDFCSRIEQFVKACAGQTPAIPPKTSISYLIPFVDDKFSDLQNKTYKQHLSPKTKSSTLPSLTHRDRRKKYSPSICNIRMCFLELFWPSADLPPSLADDKQVTWRNPVSQSMEALPRWEVWDLFLCLSALRYESTPF